MKGSVVEAEQGLVSGDAQLIPIQQWFFEQHYENKNHWNQAQLLLISGSLDLELLEKMVAGGDGDSDSVRPLSMNEMLMINSATATSVGTVIKKGKISKISLRLPICAKVGSRITLSRRVGSRWRLIGHGTIVG